MDNGYSVKYIVGLIILVLLQDKDNTMGKIVWWLLTIIVILYTVADKHCSLMI